MKQITEKKVLQLMQKVAEKKVRQINMEHNWPEWPPDCGFLIHQPKRPRNKDKFLHDSREINENSNP